jgi:hypothetical protein
MAVTQIRNPGTAGRLYYERKAHGGQDTQGSPALPQPTPLRPRLPPARPGQAEQNQTVRITYDPAADTVYIHFTSQPLALGPHHHPGRHPGPASKGSSHSPGKTTAAGWPGPGAVRRQRRLGEGADQVELGVEFLHHPEPEVGGEQEVAHRGLGFCRPRPGARRAHVRPAGGCGIAAQGSVPPGYGPADPRVTGRPASLPGGIRWGW